MDANEADYGSSSDYVLSTDGPSEGMSLVHRSDTVNSDPTAPTDGALRKNRGNITFNGITQTFPTPSNLSASTLSSTEVSFTWVAGDSETDWTYEYGVTGFSLGNGTIGTTTSTALSFSGLVPVETYDIYVQANCSSDNSAWTSTTWTMTPNCVAIISPVDGATDVLSTGSLVAFSWEAVAPANSAMTYEVFFGDASGNLTSLGTTEDTAIDIIGLYYASTYYFKVVPTINGVSASGCSEFSFTTGDATIPFSSDFENYPSGWFEAEGVYGEPTGNTSSFLQDDFGNDAASANGKSARINIYCSGIDEYLISPSFDLSGGTHYLNFDIALVEWNGTAAATLGNDDYLALLVTHDDGVSWEELARWDVNSTISNTGEAISEISLSGYGSAVKIAFYAFSDTVNEDNDLFIDNFQITTNTLGVNKNKIENFSLYPTLVKDLISFTAQDKIDIFSVYNLLGQEVFSKKIGLKTADVNLSTLKTGVYIVKCSIG